MNVHDFRNDATARAVPYGIYDVSANRGWVYVGTSADTPEFAVDAIVRWWREAGKQRYPESDRILIVADSGGSNGCRPYLWKERLQRNLADEHNLRVTVSHFPTGCSKWNPIEHRLFGPISRNWSGIPLRSLDTMLALIQGTQTKTGLTITAEILDGVYKTGKKVSKKLMALLDLVPAEVCPQWNYTLRPRPVSDPPGMPGIQALTEWDLIALIS